MTRIDSPPDFEARHLGPDAADVSAMLAALGYDSVEALVDDVVPPSIRMMGTFQTRTQMAARRPTRRSMP